MKAQDRRRGRALRLTLCGAFVLLAACTDRDSSISRQGNDAVMTGPVQPSLARARRDSLRHDFKWIGQAHNQGLDALRDRLRGGRPAGSLCSYLIDFATDPQRLPPEKRDLATQLRKRRPDAERAIATTETCKVVAREVVNGLGPVLVSPTPAPFEVSSDAISLALEIEQAVELAESAGVLSARLATILDQTAPLGSEEREALFAIASVAQSSYEYWEAQLEPMVQEIGQAYGSCATYYRDNGYDSDDARTQCFGNGLRQTREKIPAPAFGPPIRIATSPVPRCTDGGKNLGAQFRSVGRTDAKGATHGAFAGIIAGPKGIVAGAIAGGLGTSAAEAIGYAWDAWWCLMR